MRTIKRWNILKENWKIILLKKEKTRISWKPRTYADMANMSEGT